MNPLEALIEFQAQAALKVYTLGRFETYRQGQLISSKEWGRDRSVQLFQYLIATRDRLSIHKEMIMDRIWGDDNESQFKITLHGLNKVLEPNRPSRAEPKYIIRQGATYQLDWDIIWTDISHIDRLMEIANQHISSDRTIAMQAYREIVSLYKGMFLPNRIYEDWSSDERERIQILVLGCFIQLAEMNLQDNPLESIRLAEEALQIDASWEEAYRVMMQAFDRKGNRPMVIKTYQKCAAVLDEEFGIEPLPQTRKLYHEVVKR